SQDSLIAFDSIHHRMFIADCSDSRVLVFTLTIGNVLASKAPANVLGQTDFVSCGSAITQSRMSCPVGLAYDGTNNRLFVGDQQNARVLVFDTSTITNGMNASYVLGQADFISSNRVTTQSGLSGASGVALDSSNNLFVADTPNNRVLVFNVAPGSIANGENASHELGQPSGASAFTTSAAATTQSGMNLPYDPVIDSTNGRLFLSDQSNNRVLVFSTAS